MKYKYIFFDFNGTLLDDVDLCYNIENSIFAKWGIKKLSKETYLDNFCFPVKNYYEFAGFDFNKIDYSDICEMFFSEYLRQFEKETKLYPSVISSLKKLKEDGFGLYILSASEINLLIDQTKMLTIYDYFTDLVGCSDLKASGKIGYGKEFIHKKFIKSSECLMIGDTYHDYEVANELGMHCILFTKGHNSVQVLSKANVPLVNSFEEIIDFVEK
ncbi:MAG: HAD family hydrolase [Erysipelotrichaceae bacterium]|nr:HAD family hydrolase [Erysipelotrichaceae bacterium]